jgi:uncharacterized repeat protein (TIGR03943 family)
MIDRLARQISFFAPAAVMSAWATVMFHTVAAGHINRLLSPMFRNDVLAASILLVVLSVLYVLLYQPPTETAPALAPTGKLRQLGRWLVLLVPVVAASVLSPTALSNTTLMNRGLEGAAPMPSFAATNQQSVKSAIDADPNQPVPVEVTDLITLSRSPDQLKAFDGRKVRSIGQIFAGSPGTPPKLVRMIMWCCAADAQPAAVDLTGAVKGDWKPTDWLEVTGTARFPSTAGKTLPAIEVDTIKPTQEPDEPFLSP